MKRGSVIGPILLIVIGGLFLANNLRPELPLMEMIGDYWPFVLIGWGLLRLIEILFLWMGSKPLPRQGVSGGEWVFIVFMCLIGSAFFYGSRYSRNWPTARISMHGLDVLGESYDYPLEEKKITAGKTPRLMVENLRGNARILGADTEEITVKGRTTVRAFQRDDADKVNKDCPMEIVRQGDLFVIRTNQDKATGTHKISSDLEITVPRGATVEGRGRYGDFDISGVQGNVDINSDNAGVRLNDIGGAVRVDLRRSDLVRAVNVKGGVELKGGGWDVELENIEGPVTVAGSYSGELIFRKLAKPFRFDSSSTELRVERIGGQLRMGRGDLQANDITGPFQLKTGSKDVELSDFTQGVEISVQRGDIDLRPGKLPLAAMNVRTKSGDVQISLPASAKFELKATTTRGEAENDFGSPLQTQQDGRRSSISGTTGTGPLLQLSTDRGTLTVRKSSLDEIPAPPEPPAPKAPKSKSGLPVDHQ
jgi:DUF4097 and DUF4098 domain-containing protein YvlB